MSSSDASAIIHALGGSYETGMCRCPCHDDTTPSLHVSYRNDKVLVHCHAGCTQERVVDYLKSHGLWPKSRAATQKSRTDWYLEQEQKRDEEYRRLCRARRIVREAGFRGRDVTLVEKYLRRRGIEHAPSCALGLTVRQTRKLFNGLGFPAMVFPIHGKYGLQGVHVTFLSRDGSTKLDTDKPRKMYGTSKGGHVVVSKLNPKRPLIIGEGIETTLSACQLTGLPGIAALSAGNLPKIVPPPCSEIIIAADNDDAGRDAAERAAQIWTMAGFKVYIAPAPDRGSDWNDALLDAKTDRDRGKLREAIFDKAELVRPDNTDPARFAFSMEQVLDMVVQPREYLLKPWLESSSINMIHAQRGHGKTRFMMAVAYAIATKQDLMLWSAERKARVLYVDGELPLSLLQKRLRLLGQPEPNLTVLSRDLILRAGTPLPDLAQPEGRAFLDAIIDALDIDVVVLDSLSTLMRSGVENEAESWAPIQDWMLGHRFRGRTFILVHHEGKSGKPRGTSKREDVMDSIIKLKELESGADASKYELSFTKTREFYGAAKAPLVLHMSEKDGVARWRHELAHDHLRERAMELTRQGWKQKDIAEELDVSQPRISQILKAQQPQPRGRDADDGKLPGKSKRQKAA